jgi:hypothetical protein
MPFIKYTKVRDDNRETNNSIIYETDDHRSFILVTFNNNGNDVNITAVKQIEDGPSITSNVFMFEVNGILFTKQPWDTEVKPLNQQFSGLIKTQFNPCNVVYAGNFENFQNMLPQSNNPMRSIAQVFFANDPTAQVQGGKKKRAPSVRRVTKK